MICWKRTPSTRAQAGCAGGVHWSATPREAAKGPAAATEVSLRYSDFDGNAHLNNTAYLDCLQTALSRQALPVRPRAVEMQFLKEVSPGVAAVQVALERAGERGVFAVRSGAELHAQGAVGF